MKVKEIIKQSAKYLNMESVLEALDNNAINDDQVKEDISNFLIAINMTNNSIASNYIELFDIVEINNKKDIMPFSDFTTFDVIEIKKVLDKNGNDLSFKVTPVGVQTSKGNICIEYSYFPMQVGLDDEINYYTKLNSMVFALGVVGEYLFLKGALNDAYVWDKKFKSTLFSLSRPKRNINIPVRRWE